MIPKGAKSYMSYLGNAEQAYARQRQSHGAEPFAKVKKPRVSNKNTKTAMITGVRGQTKKALKLKEGAGADAKRVMDAVMNRESSLTDKEKKAVWTALTAQHVIWMDKVVGEHLIRLQEQKERELTVLERHAAVLEKNVKLMQDAFERDECSFFKMYNGLRDPTGRSNYSDD
ncbi:hypothetical protein QFC19_009110 [Naganishia cerealis]|uniref:Uncharacterized protein n=1 Tax=Naganishia cerealis TaxID=610337 RepID=A0ACC2UWY3_9TREE|nr:hypothetical protein QFC19_009110 [Naganishia cerealis]